MGRVSEDNRSGGHRSGAPRAGVVIAHYGVRRERSQDCCVCIEQAGRLPALSDRASHDAPAADNVLAVPVLDGLHDAVERQRSATLFDAGDPTPALTTELLDVTVREELDSSDAQAVFVIMTLSDPPKDTGAWPVEDIWELRRLLQAAIEDIQPDMTRPWYVRFVTREADVSAADDEPGPTQGS